MVESHVSAGSTPVSGTMFKKKQEPDAPVATEEEAKGTPEEEEELGALFREALSGPRMIVEEHTTVHEPFVLITPECRAWALQEAQCRVVSMEMSRDNGKKFTTAEFYDRVSDLAAWICGEDGDMIADLV